MGVSDLGLTGLLVSEVSKRSEVLTAALNELERRTFRVQVTQNYYKS